jgi:HPt (histidine-containing phosphotransfer) domain-containing protein
MNEKEAQLDALLTSLWERNLPTLYERLELLDRVAAESASGNLTGIKREEAFDIAHKLAGSLGMFGYHQGTEIARQIERILSSPIPAPSDHLANLVTDLREILIKK